MLWFVKSYKLTVLTQQPNCVRRKALMPSSKMLFTKNHPLSVYCIQAVYDLKLVIRLALKSYDLNLPHHLSMRCFLLAASLVHSYCGRAQIVVGTILLEMCLTSIHASAASSKIPPLIPG